VKETGSDDSLMKRIGGGDAEAFETLYRRWARPVMAYAYRSLCDRGEAEDVVQETFLAVFRSASRYVPSERFGAYLFRIAGNAVRSRYRRKRPVVLVDFSEIGENGLEDLEEPSPSPFSRFEEGETINRALERLSFEQRECLLLAAVGGLSYSQIAQSAGISEDVVAARISRARKKLKKILAGGEHEEEEKRNA
jgi:RNA polymerase sigma-70 factor (ECF subfamily)